MHNATKHTNSNVIEKPKNKKTWIILSIIAIIILGFFIFSKYNLTGKSVDGEMQKITLSMKNYNYYPNTINVKEGVPVEITLDKSVVGCYRSFNIRDFGISKYLSSPSDTILFTPDKKGTFEFACSMRMGRGTIIVE